MDYIAHHGVKGQRWGIRRYQNPDGTLTADGRSHYGLDGRSFISPNTKNKIKKFAVGGLAIGAAAGVALGTATGAQYFIDYMNYMPSTLWQFSEKIVSNTMTIMGQEAVANAKVMGLTGLAYGSIIGAMAGQEEDNAVRRKYGRA